MEVLTMLGGPFRLAIALCAVLTTSARSLEMYWVDVEGGAATLIVTAAGESILIDSGNPGGRDPKRIIQAAKDAGVDRIDHLVTTHFHIDHFGGAAEIAQALPIGTVYDNGIPDQNPDNPADKESFERNIRPYREMKVGKRVVLKPGDFIPLKQVASAQPVSIQCLAGMQNRVVTVVEPGAKECENLKEKDKDTSDNSNSLALLLKYGQFKMFDGGDMTWNIEAKLACPANLVGTVDIYDVDHHGLDVSNNPVLVHALKPTVAIMSNGTSKGCGPETFSTLKNTPSIQAIYQTHRNLRADNENNTVPECIANLEKDCAANYVKVRVSDDTKSYAVSIPARNQSRSFQTK